MTIKNLRTVEPSEMEPGDVLVCIVALHVGYWNMKGKPVVSLYRCPYPDPQIGRDGVPQGDKIVPLKQQEGQALLKLLFPVMRGHHVER